VLKPITEAEIEELVKLSEGRAFSWVDSPEWFCGDRHVTFAARDGLVPDGPLAGGTMQSLAGSMNGHCRDYLQLVKDIAFYRYDNTIMEGQYKRSKSVKRRAELDRLMYQNDRGAKVAKEQIDKLVAKYFRGYEGRFLIAEVTDAASR